MLAPFAIAGAAVATADLLRLQTLAVDLQRLRGRVIVGQRSGEQRSRLRGQGREFIEMKAYQSGDDVRQIDWRLTAKKQLPYVRVMQEDRHAEQLIWLPLTSQLYFGTRRCFKSVLACHWAAFLCWRFVQLRQPVRLFIQVGDQAPLEQKVANQAQAAAACQQIATAHAALAQNFRQLQQSVQLPKWRSSPTLWAIADFSEPLIKTLTALLQQRPLAALHCLQTLDYFDVELPNAGPLPVRKPQGIGVIATGNPQLQNQYRQAAEQRQSALQQLCWRYRGQLLQYYSDQFSWQDVQQWPLYH